MNTLNQYFLLGPFRVNAIRIKIWNDSKGRIRIKKKIIPDLQHSKMVKLLRSESNCCFYYKPIMNTCVIYLPKQ
jgi:hypothetical protein